MAAAQKTLASMFNGASFVNKKGEKVGIESLDKKIVGIYFSAHWCPPCRGFTPVLAKAYNELQAQNKAFEIVFLSSDQDAASFAVYFTISYLES